MSEDNPVQRHVEQLYEDEGLTDSLTDEEAMVLLGWGEQQLKSLASLAARPDQLDSAARRLYRLVRTINRFIGQKAELSETQMIQRLLRLVEQAMQFNQQKSLIEITGSTTREEEEEA